jgi:hypothetical protein
MMFASSFVEEEQHFWYWSASGWLAYLYFAECVLSSRTAKPYLLFTKWQIGAEPVDFRKLQGYCLLGLL